MSEQNDDSVSDKTMVATENTLKRTISTADQAPPVLVVLVGPPAYQGKQWPLTADETTIGRVVDCKIFIDDRSLSRAHARVEINGTQVNIVDMGSTNKTAVNGQVLPANVPYTLKNNDQIKTGNVIFKFLEQGSIEALTNQALFERANRDALTGAYSKGFLLERGPEAMKRADILGEPLSVIMFDIDHFKKINDTQGHPGGDYVLKELCKIVTTKIVRSGDFFARYGGEEFVLIMTGAGNKAAAEVAERVRQTVQGHEFLYEGTKIEVTVSLGVATKQATDLAWEDLINRTDKNLYVSKQTGRNRVTVTN